MTLPFSDPLPAGKRSGWVKALDLLVALLLVAALAWASSPAAARAGSPGLPALCTVAFTVPTATAAGGRGASVALPIGPNALASATRR